MRRTMQTRHGGLWGGWSCWTCIAQDVSFKPILKSDLRGGLALYVPHSDVPRLLFHMLVLHTLVS